MASTGTMVLGSVCKQKSHVVLQQSRAKRTSKKGSKKTDLIQYWPLQGSYCHRAGFTTANRPNANKRPGAKFGKISLSYLDLWHFSPPLTKLFGVLGLVAGSSLHNFMAGYLSTSDFQNEVGEVFGEIGGELPAKFGRRLRGFQRGVFVRGGDLNSWGGSAHRLQ